MHPATIPHNAPSGKLDPRVPADGDSPGDPVVVSVDLMVGEDAAEQN